MNRRGLAAALVTLALTAVAVGYAVFGRAHGPAITAVTLAGPGLLLRDTANGHIGLRDPQGTLRLGPLECARVHAAAGMGVCLRPDPLSPSTFEIALFDTHLKVTRQIPLVGVPSRARVSASGRMVSWTVFVTGDSYNGGRFSTRSGILDTRTGLLEGTLEDFAVTVDGKPYTEADRNFWGITFAADDNTFYATMSTAGHRYLVTGDLAARSVRTVVDNVECPSLSSDGKRLVYKKKVSAEPAHMWRLTVLDLSTLTETPLAETRSVDDQAVWLDDGTIGYAVVRGAGRADVWAVPADGTGSPHLLAPDAESPAVLPDGKISWRS